MPSVVVIGASRGIGLELAGQYAADGWQVHATVRTEADRDRLSAIDGVEAGIADVLDEASLRGFAAALPGTVDLLVLNAGVGSREAKLADVDAAAWTRVMTVNALGPLLAARAFCDKIVQGGRIAALSSTMGSIGENGGGAWSYRMSKAALNMGLSCLAIELKPRGIAVAALHPGWVRTDMGGEQAPLSPAESVRGLRAVIDSLSVERSGCFLDHAGRTIAW